ncbi:NADPH:quinone reductase-like Zn-dependent oxidoreductase [Streptosporangium becharense]|uniref:NADPH:quinone reductase-like Zn-dependent oxidoreductase n=1 Tax=Streptosporangium becharense TaxID=1816182 RepID=A0A7W9IC46_9ACTN|nr:zinc-dependent alcohol dehydrogenase family protein [Streptosporangium becharense]MBB2910723.1 NADPH:quinone reductase-like Zn-dependent oxidoreductase [Streptosporangium becharense]MBB5817418.1 NADPH:quinone reductase-like Zn-dependent oxidoreductase [Streptosporangium becharense]
MRRAIARAFGPAAEVVEVESYTPPPPQEGEVRVRMTAATVNPSDLVTISGAYRSRTVLPLVPGFEGVGVVERTGPGVTGLRPGDRVLPIGSAGAWQQVKTTAAHWCFRVRPELTDAQAALSYINPLTALRMVEEFVDPLGRPVVAVNAARSAIAVILARLLRRRGVHAVGLVRGPADPAPPVSSAGEPWSAVLSTDAPDWPAELTRLTGGGPGVAFDAVGGEEGEQLALLTRARGTLVHYGLLSGRPLPPDLARRRPDLRVALYMLRSWVHTADHPSIQRALDEAGELVLRGDVATPVQEEFPLEGVRDAIVASTTRASLGKVLILP